MRKAILPLLLLLCFSAHAQGVYSDTYVIPIAGHTAGANGTMWMSDVVLRNFQTAPLDVELIYIESGNDFDDNVQSAGSVTIPANGTVMLHDLLADMGNTIGALVVGADKPFAVSSRTYSTMGAGETVPATADFFEMSVGTSDNDAVAYIPGVMNDANMRTNIGFVAGNGGAEPMVIEVTVRNANGTLAGVRNFTVPAASFAHMQFPLSQITSSTVTLGSVEMRIKQGDGSVVPYASVIDNRTGTASYVMGQFPASETSMSSFGAPNVFRSLLGRRIQ